MDFNKTCTDIFLAYGKELIRFWCPLCYFQGHRISENVDKGRVFTLSPEWIIRPAQIYLWEIKKKTGHILATLASFSRSLKVKEYCKTPCFYHIS